MYSMIGLWHIWICRAAGDDFISFMQIINVYRKFMNILDVEIPRSEAPMFGISQVDF